MCAPPVVFSPFSPRCRTKNVSSVFRLPYALFMCVMVVYCVKNFCFCRVLGHARLRNPGSTSIRNDTSGPGAVRRSHHKPRSTAGRPGVRARDLVIDRPVPHHVSGAAAVLARDGRQATGEKVSFLFFLGCRYCCLLTVTLTLRLLHAAANNGHLLKFFYGTGTI